MKVREPGSTKDVVTRTVEQAGAKRAAFLLDRSKTTVYAYGDPDEPDQISFDQMRRLVAGSRATAPAEDLASLAGGFFVPGEIEEDCLHKLAARSVKEWGEAIAAIFAACQDPARRSDALRELDEAMRAVVCVRVHLADGGTLPCHSANVTPLKRGA
jgi:hypothetical protein